MTTPNAPRRSRPALVLALGLVSSALVAATGDCTVPEVHDAVVSSFDGTEIAVTTFRPCGVTEDAPSPVVLTLHGWAGSRSVSPDAADVAPLVEGGYGVVSIDARGHGDSGGAAHIHHPDWEVRDFRAVLDWIHDTLPWVRREPDSGIERDIVAGSYGGSYGGGFQLMTAAFDDRLDAIVPMHTWHDLRQALAPNRGAVKSAWLTLLYAAGKTEATLSADLDGWFVETMRENAAPHEATHSLAQSSPGRWMGRIDVPALLVQGLPDTLFNLNEAVANYEGLRLNGVSDVRLIGTNDGHQLPALQPAVAAASPRGQGTSCVDVAATIRDFLDTHLRHDGAAAGRLAAVPRVVLTTEQDGCVSGPDWPLTDHELTFPFPVLAAPNPAGGLLLPLFTAQDETTIVGIPTISGNTVVEFDDFFYFSLVVRSSDGVRVVGDQVTPFRVRPNPCGAPRPTQAATSCGAALRGPAVTIPLGGVATTLQRGEELLLAVDGFHPQFALNGNRRPGAALLTSVVARIPIA